MVDRYRKVVSFTLSPYHIKIFDEIVAQANKGSVRRITKSEIIESLLSRAEVDKKELYRRRLMELESRKAVLQKEINMVANDLHGQESKEAVFNEEVDVVVNKYTNPED